MKRQRLVHETTAKLRALILAMNPGDQIGSLCSIARELGVGIVTVQQAARVLEHEGLLAVKRGPQGGYYGCRPTLSMVAQALNVYCRSHHIDIGGVMTVVALLDREIAPAAIRGADEKFLEDIAVLKERLDSCISSADQIWFEDRLHQILYRSASNSFLVTISQLVAKHVVPDHLGLSIGVWRDSRRRLLLALQQRDEELAKFEVERFQLRY